MPKLKLLAPGFLVLLFSCIVYLLPVHVSETSPGEPTLRVGASIVEAPGAVATHSVLELSLVDGDRVSVEQITDGQGVIVPLQGQRGWWTKSGVSTTVAIGRPLRVDSSLRQLNLLLRSVDSGSASVKVALNDGVGQRVELQGADPVSLQIGSEATLITTSQRFGFRSLEIRPGSDVRAWIGPLPIEVDEQLDGSHRVLAQSVLTAILKGIWSATNVVVIALLMVVAFAAVGLGLLRGVADEVDPYVALAFGVALPALLLGALNYLLPVKFATVLVMSGVGLTVMWRQSRFGITAGQAARDYWAMLSALSLGWPTFLAVVFVGFPAALTQSTNLGMLQTDIYDYLHVQRTFWNSSIVSAGLDWGDGLRSIDSSARVAIGGWTQLSAMESFNAVRFITVVVALVAVGGGCRALGAKPWVCALTQLGVVSVASLQSLWLEGYLSREMFIWIAIPTVAVPIRVFASENSARSSYWVALGVIFAWPAALVPPFMVTLVAPAIGLLALFASDGWTTARRSAQFFAASFLAVLLPNLKWALNVDRANVYANNVENIGKVFVVPFYADPEFPAAAAGLTGFHTNQLSRQGPQALAWIPGPADGLLRFLNGAASSWTVVLATAAVLALATAVIWYQADPPVRAPALALVGIAWAAALAVPVLLIVAWEDQSFFVMMWIWTLSALVLVPILIGASVLRGRLGAIIGAGLMLVMGFNLGSSTLEISLWFSHPQDEAARFHHFDLASDTLEIQDLLSSGVLEPRDYRVEVPHSEAVLTDDHRVLLNLLSYSFDERGAHCVNCIRNENNGAVANYEPGSNARSDRVLVIGATRCLTGEPLYEGLAVALCGR